MAGITLASHHGGVSDENPHFITTLCRLFGIGEQRVPMGASVDPDVLRTIKLERVCLQNVTLRFRPLDQDATENAALLESLFWEDKLQRQQNNAPLYFIMLLLGLATRIPLTVEQHRMYSGGVMRDHYAFFTGRHYDTTGSRENGEFDTGTWIETAPPLGFSMMTGLQWLNTVTAILIPAALWYTVYASCCHRFLSTTTWYWCSVCSWVILMVLFSPPWTVFFPWPDNRASCETQTASAVSSLVVITILSHFHSVGAMTFSVWFVPYTSIGFICVYYQYSWVTAIFRSPSDTLLTLILPSFDALLTPICRMQVVAIFGFFLPFFLGFATIHEEFQDPRCTLQHY